MSLLEITPFIQRLSLTSHWADYRQFQNSLAMPQAVQLKRLQNYFGCPDYKAFTKEYPVTEFKDWEPWIQQLRAQKSGLHFEPTSGSTHQRKWIPYTPQLMREFNAAASAWLADLSLAYPGILQGKHYWSLSWLPNELRGGDSSNDDVKVFPWWKQFFMNQVMAVPNQVSLLGTMQDSTLATLVFLCANRNLAMISVWSPTFLLELLRSLSDHKEKIAEILTTGKWPLGFSPTTIKAPQAQESGQFLQAWDGQLSVDFLQKLWPALQLISCWDSSTSQRWAEKLRHLFPQVVIQGKGLWATEAVVTIPFQGQYPLAITSHFLEFRDLDSQKIYPSWELQKGQRVQPILTTGSGFYRYVLRDQLVVSDFCKKTPCLSFLGRDSGVDLVGEKMDSAAVSVILNQISKDFSVNCLCLIGKSKPHPHYFLLVQGVSGDLAALICDKAEQLFCRFHHYQVAREAGQLGPVQISLHPQAMHEYFQKYASRIIAGSRKVEPLFAETNV